MAARLFLFYGTDSRASQAAIREWELLFRTKYGEATRYVLNADELSIDELKQRLASILQGQTLFPVPKLLIVKRLTARDSGSRSSLSAAFTELIGQYTSAIDEAVTLAVWEEKDLKEIHPLLQKFTQWQTEKKAKIRLFPVPTDRQISSRIQEYVAGRQSEITKEALSHIQHSFESMGKQARLAKKLKYSEVLLEDERTWWVYNLLDTALLASAGSPISLELVLQLQVSEPPAVGVFEVVNAIQKRQWNQARALLVSNEQVIDSSFYFSLVAALRWQHQKSSDPLEKMLVQWLAEIEILLKNFPVNPVWLFCLLVDRLDAFSKGEEKRSLLAPRKLWLAHLMRS